MWTRSRPCQGECLKRCRRRVAPRGRSLWLGRVIPWYVLTFVAMTDGYLKERAKHARMHAQAHARVHSIHDFKEYRDIFRRAFAFASTQQNRVANTTEPYGQARQVDAHRKLFVVRKSQPVANSLPPSFRKSCTRTSTLTFDRFSAGRRAIDSWRAIF